MEEHRSKCIHLNSALRQSIYTPHALLTGTRQALHAPLRRRAHLRPWRFTGDAYALGETRAQDDAPLLHLSGPQHWIHGRTPLGAFDDDDDEAITTYAVAGDEAFTWTELLRRITKGNCHFYVVYDNVIGGEPKEELERYWAEIVQRLTNPTGLNAWIKEQSSAIVGSSLQTLGLEWFPSTEGLRWTFLKKFVDKLSAMDRSLRHESHVSAKQIAGSLGLVAWGRYATFGSMFDLTPCYKRLAELVSRSGWSIDESKWYSSVAFALRGLIASGIHAHKLFSEEIVVFSDAHITGYGFIGGFPLSHDSVGVKIGVVGELRL